MVGPGGTPPEDAELIDLDALPPEQIIMMLMVMIAQNIRKADFTEEFILVCRRNNGSNAVYSTIRDQDVLCKRLAGAAKAVKETEPEEETVCAEDFIPRKN